jgi:hypothetical protein
LSGHNITVDGYYGHNGDDCVSVINGAQDIVAKNGYCGFSSHGLSIGSLGRNGANHTVKNVLFKNWTMEGAVYGARVRHRNFIFLILILMICCSAVQELDWRPGFGRKHCLGGYYSH